MVFQVSTALTDHQDPQIPYCSCFPVSSLHILVLVARQGQEFAIPLTERDVYFTPVLQIVPLVNISIIYF